MMTNSVRHGKTAIGPTAPYRSATMRAAPEAKADHGR
jgi:hypothetical protein